VSFRFSTFPRPFYKDFFRDSFDIGILVIVVLVVDRFIDPTFH
jgi:hypothetical protein